MGSSMTDTRFDRAPGDRPILTDMEEGRRAAVLVYTIGLVLAVILTATSFWVAQHIAALGAWHFPRACVLATRRWGVPPGLLPAITTGPDNTNNVAALAFGRSLCSWSSSGRSDHGESERQPDRCRPSS